MSGSTRLTRFSFALSVVLSLPAFGAKIAVIDSGVDYKHEALSARMWTNPESQTNVEGKVYSGDTHGWNFAENNNKIIDYKYLGTFSDDCTKIFLVQSKILLGTASEEEKTWYKEKKADPTFLKELSKFGNFVHGTHVSGISANEAEMSKIVGMKLIPTEPPMKETLAIAEAIRERGALDEETPNPLVQMYLSMLAKQQSQMLVTVGKYTKAVKAEVANGSFGTSVTAVKPVIKPILSQLLGKEPTEQEVTMYAKYLVTEMVKAGKDFPGASPETLFVFAAGNDATNNDELPASPANVKAQNTIAVAATLGVAEIAPFSNYGATQVEVAAPGVAIRSTIPGDEYLPMSGTSMAAPYVTNVAARVKDANGNLKAVDVKKVLMQTVDVKDFLKGKVVTSGIVNRERAVKAAELSKTMPLDKAIAQARNEIKDMREDAFDSVAARGPVLFVPLPSTF